MTEVPYGPGSGSTDGPAAVLVIDGRAGRTVANALTLTLSENGTELAVAKQGSGEGAGKKLGILFGFKNYEAMTTELQLPDGTTLVIPTKDKQPTPVTRGDGTAVATLTRGETTVATTPDGAVVMRFVSDPTDPDTVARFRLLILDSTGATLGRIDLIRTAAGWDPDTVLEAFTDLITWSPGGGGGNSLPMHYLGTRAALLRQPTPLERELVLVASVELGVYARPYTTSMETGKPAG